MKRAQMEAFGLAVIVILIALGILFALQFTVLSPKQELRKPFVEQQLASNLLGAILITSVTQYCPQAKDFTDLFVDYARCDRAVFCTENLNKSYEYVTENLEAVFNKTLSASNKPYRFEIRMNPDILADCLNKDPSYPENLTVESGFTRCLAGGDITPARFFIPIGSGFPPVQVDLAICS